MHNTHTHTHTNTQNTHTHTNTNAKTHMHACILMHEKVQTHRQTTYLRTHLYNALTAAFHH